MATETLDLSNRSLRIAFDPAHGGRLAQVWFDEVPVLVDSGATADQLLGWGCYPMVPWAGRLAEGCFQFRRRSIRLPTNLDSHAIHGLGMGGVWDVVGSSRTSLVSRLNLDGAGWPFRSWCEQRISLGPTTLSMEMSVHSEGDEFPAQVGWHPWFRPPTSLAITPGTMFVRDSRGITTTATRPPTTPPWDDCFTDLTDNPKLVVNGVGIELSSSSRYWVVYTEHQNGVCIEPQSGIPNAFNSFSESGLDIVGPGRPLRHSFCWEFSH